MWHTPCGDRVICGAEAELIRVSIDLLVESIQEEGFEEGELQFSSGIQIFDELTWTQKLAAVEQVARYLLTSTPDILPLSAVNEAVVGAIFEHVNQMVELEIASESFGIFSAVQADENPFYRWSWRESVIQAVLERVTEAELSEMHRDGFYLPTSTCTDLETWSDLIENLADQILWDRDYELAAAFMDDDPEIAAAEKKMFGIDQDYFTELTPDPREDQMQPVLFSIQKLVRSKPK